MNKERSLRKMIVAAFLIALSIVLTRMLSITTPFFRIGFGSIPIMIAGIVLGPQTGFLVGGVADLVGFMMSPMGSFMPGFTLTSALTGAIPGVLWKMTSKRERTWGKKQIWVVAALLLTGVSASVFRAGSIRWESGQLIAGEVAIDFIHLAATAAVLIVLLVFTGIRLHKDQHEYSMGRLLFVVMLTNVICSIGLNTLWLSILFGKGFLALLPARIVVNLITIPVHTIIIYHLSRTFSYFNR